MQQRSDFRHALLVAISSLALLAGSVIAGAAPASAYPNVGGICTFSQNPPTVGQPLTITADADVKSIPSNDNEWTLKIIKSIDQSGIYSDVAVQKWNSPPPYTTQLTATVTVEERMIYACVWDYPNILQTSFPYRTLGQSVSWKSKLPLPAPPPPIDLTCTAAASAPGAATGMPANTIYAGDAFAITAEVANASSFDETYVKIRNGVSPLIDGAGPRGSFDVPGTGATQGWNCTATAKKSGVWASPADTPLTSTVLPLPTPVGTATPGNITLGSSGVAFREYTLGIQGGDPVGWTVNWASSKGSPPVGKSTALGFCGASGIDWIPTLTRPGVPGARIIVGQAVTVQADCSLSAPVITSTTVSGGNVTVNYLVASAPTNAQIVPEYRVSGGSWQSAPSQPFPAGGSGTLTLAAGIVPPQSVDVRIKVGLGNISSAWSNDETTVPTNPSVTYGQLTGTEAKAIKAISPSTTPNGSLAAMQASGATWSVSGAPKGITIDSKTGVLSGTPKVSGTGSFVVTVSGGSGSTRWQSTATVTFTIDPRVATVAAGTLSYLPITTTTGIPVSSTPTAPKGVRGSYFAPDLCSKVPGLDIDPVTGKIFGSPRSVVNTTVTVEIRDNAPSGPSGCVKGAGRVQATGSLKVIVKQGTATLAYPSSKVTIPMGSLYAMQPSDPSPSSQTGLEYLLVGGQLPAGLTLDKNSGSISGTPTSPVLGAHVTIGTKRAGSAARPTFDVDFTVFDASNATKPTYPNVASGIGVAKSVTPSQLAGWTSFALAAGSPSGMTIDTTTGEITWTAVAPAGPVTIAVTANNPGGQSVTLDPFTWDVQQPPASSRVAPTSAAASIKGGGATGGRGASSGSGGSGSFTPCIAPAGMIYPDIHGSVGSTLTFAPNLNGLPLDSTFTVIGGALPPGVTLDREAGVISGTPEKSNNGFGPVQIAVTAPDGTRRVADISIGIDDPHHGVNYPNRVIGSVGSPLTVTPFTVNEHGKTTYEIVCGSLPAGMGMDANTGVISGTPTSVDERPIPLRIRITDDYGWVDSSQLIVVNQGTTPWLRYPEFSEISTGQSTRIVPTVSGLGEVGSYQIEGDLPAGLVFDTATGVISGRSMVGDDPRVYEPTITALAPTGDPLASTWASLTVIKPAVPMQVVSKKATAKLKRGKSVVLVSKVKRPTWVSLNETVKCKGCSWKLNKKTGKLTVKPGKKTKRVSVTILGSPKGTKYTDTYAGHAWSRSWKVKR